MAKLNALDFYYGHITIDHTVYIIQRSHINYFSVGCTRRSLVWYITSRQPLIFVPWWRHQMESFPALLALCAVNSPVPGEFPSQRPVTRSFKVFFDLCLNKRLGKQPWGWWFETPPYPWIRHSNVRLTQHITTAVTHRSVLLRDTLFLSYNVLYMHTEELTACVKFLMWPSGKSF